MREVLKNPSDDEDTMKESLQQWVKSRLACHEYPREIEFVEDLPMTASGKIRRNVLREWSHGTYGKKEGDA
jgi:acetyl-CoA synthetase